MRRGTEPIQKTQPQPSKQTLTGPEKPSPELELIVSNSEMKDDNERKGMRRTSMFQILQLKTFEKANWHEAGVERGVW